MTVDVQAAGSIGKLPDYRWVVEEESIILRAEAFGLAEHISVYPEVLTFAGNGDLLMAACRPGLIA